MFGLQELDFLRISKVHRIFQKDVKNIFIAIEILSQHFR